MDLPDLSRVREFAFDFETWDPYLQSKGPGFVYKRAKVIGIAVYLDTGFNCYFPLRHSEGNIDYSQLKPWLIELFSSDLRTSIAANYRYDAECLWSMGIENKTYQVDIQILEALLDEVVIRLLRFVKTIVLKKRRKIRLNKLYLEADMF